MPGSSETLKPPCVARGCIFVTQGQSKSAPNATVLLVDDDASIRQLYRILLSRNGFRVHEASGGAEALTLAREQPPTVILLDVVMPGMDGLETTRRLRADLVTRDMPILMLSGRADASDIDAALAAGADDYLIKPAAERELVMRVRSMSRLGQACNELRRSYEVLGEQTRALTLLLDLSASLVLHEDLDVILETTVDFASRLTFCRRVAVLLPDAEGRVLQVAGSIGFEPHEIADLVIPIGGSMLGQVFVSNTRFVPSSVPAGDEVSSGDRCILRGEPVAALPMRASERIVGVLAVADRINRDHFSSQELEYLELTCNYAASAVEAVLTRRAREDARDSVVVALAQLAEHRDTDTGLHLDRMTGYCLRLTEALRTMPKFTDVITPDFIKDLSRAAPLHDIGKVAIPDHILLKPGKLTPEEMAVMRTHAAIGTETIRSVRARSPGSTFLIMAEDIAHGHHEWYDGTGYPRGIAGENIPLSARIAALADVYDALTSRRVYKNAMSHEKARAIIVDARGTQFDPDVVDAFLQCEDAFKDLATELADDVPDSGPRDRAVAATCATSPHTPPTPSIPVHLAFPPATRNSPAAARQ